jgi:hypothetical protein
VSVPGDPQKGKPDEAKADQAAADSAEAKATEDAELAAQASAGEAGGERSETGPREE